MHQSLNDITYIEFAHSVIRSRRLSYRTEYSYRLLIDKYFVPYFKDTKIDALKVFHFVEFVDGLTTNIHKIFNVLRFTLRRLYRLEVIPKDYYAMLEKPTGCLEPRTPKRALTRDELNALLGYLETHHPRIAPLVRLMFYSGIRMGELLALQWHEIEFLSDSELYLNINTSYGLVAKGVYDRKDTKTTSSKRCVYVNDRYTTMALKRLYKVSKSKLWVAENSTGTAPIHPDNFNKRYFRRPALALGMPHLSSHYARVNYISYAMQKCVPLKTLSSQVGHTSADMITKVYSKLVESPRDTLKDIHIYS